MARIANKQIDKKISNLESFENYNGSIYATHSGNIYTVVHWNTVILRYDVEGHKVDFLASGYISQTTSTLVGRIIRSLPRSAVSSMLLSMNKYDQRRLLKMLRW